MNAKERMEAAINLKPVDQVPNARLVGIQAGKQACACGAATGRAVKLRELPSLRGELVYCGRANLSAVCSGIRITHII